MKRSRAALGDHGAVALEFLVALGPVLLIFLGMVQMAFIHGARIVVRHAAVRAARSAAVVQEDDPARYSETSGFPGSGGASRDLLDLVDGNPASREDVIRRAAAVPLAPFAPDPRELARWMLPGARRSVAAAVGDGGLARAAFGALVYHRAALALSYPERADGERVSVRVTYLFHCGVPVAARLLCKAAATVLAEVEELAFLPEPGLARHLAEAGHRVLALQATASFPRQRAGYRVRGQDD